MASIISLLQLQCAGIEDRWMQNFLKATMTRIHSMMLIQEKLYQSKDLTRIDLNEYLVDIAKAVFGYFDNDSRGTFLGFHIEPISVSTDTAIPCGLIVVELITNAMKYAFPGDWTGEIRVSLKKKDESKIELGVVDNGIGMPENFELDKQNSLGLQLVNGLVEQIGGTLELRGETGTGFFVRFRDLRHKTP